MEKHHNHQTCFTNIQDSMHAGRTRELWKTHVNVSCVEEVYALAPQWSALRDVLPAT